MHFLYPFTFLYAVFIVLLHRVWLCGALPSSVGRRKPDSFSGRSSVLLAFNRKKLKEIIENEFASKNAPLSNCRRRPFSQSAERVYWKIKTEKIPSLPFSFYRTSQYWPETPFFTLFLLSLNTHHTPKLDHCTWKNSHKKKRTKASNRGLTQKQNP